LRADSRSSSDLLFFVEDIPELSFQKFNDEI